MNKKELSEKLAQYPDDAEICLLDSSEFPGNIQNVSNVFYKISDNEKQIVLSNK